MLQSGHRAHRPAGRHPERPAVVVQPGRQMLPVQEAYPETIRKEGAGGWMSAHSRWHKRLGQRGRPPGYGRPARVQNPLAARRMRHHQGRFRELTRSYGLPTADKPSYSCLATRSRPDILYERASRPHRKSGGKAFDMGFSDFRVRRIRRLGASAAAEAQLPKSF